MADPHAHDDYVRGSQEISEQESTYQLFMGMAKYGSLAIAALLALLTIWFMPGGSFIGGAIAFVVMMAAGIVFLRKPKAH
jgi:Bacterial aa3 type cytochrome c oxidase subunit IV